MATPRKITQDEYDEFRSRMEEKYGYEDMSDEEKAEFDEKLDQVAVVEGNADNSDDDVIERGERDGGRPPRDDDDERVF